MHALYDILARPFNRLFRPSTRATIPVCAAGVYRIFTDEEDWFAIFICDVTHRPDDLIGVGNRVEVHEYRTLTYTDSCQTSWRCGGIVGCEVEGEIVEIRRMERKFVELVVRNTRVSTVRYVYLSLPYDCVRLSLRTRFSRWFRLMTRNLPNTHEVTILRENPEAMPLDRTSSTSTSVSANGEFHAAIDVRVANACV